MNDAYRPDPRGAPFRDREEAGDRLARLLEGLGGERPVVLGIPRGGVVVAARVAAALDGDLGVIVARKLGAPGWPEVAIGAVTADGVAFIDEARADEVGADAAYIEAEIERQAREARRREERFGAGRPPVAGRPVIVVDDGVATGATAIAALRAVRHLGARPVIFAVPVGPPRTLGALRRDADRVVCLREDPAFRSVGEHYASFEQTEDAEVEALLERFARRRDPAYGRPARGT